MKIYMGILYQPKVSKGLPDDMDDSDDEEGFEAAVAAAAQQETPTAEPEPLQPSLVEFDENTAAVPSASIVNRDERLMQAFADDPETNVKIMLSSWFREKGMIWYVSLSACLTHSFDPGVMIAGARKSAATARNYSPSSSTLSYAQSCSLRTRHGRNHWLSRTPARRSSP